MEKAVSESALNQLFLRARNYNEWSDKTVDDSTVRQVYELLKWGPTSANSCPARFTWVRSSEGKSRLAALASERNRPKILAAPLTVIIGNDLSFPDTLPKLIGERVAEAAKYFAQPGVTETTAMRNGSLQGSISSLPRALGLDCGPMSGFDNAGVDKEFFAGTLVQSNFICNLGYGKPDSPFPRNPRLSFEEAGYLA